MTLPSLNLDDKTFAQLLEDARKLIPRYAPEWTDHNEHDPGITLIELLAWLAENQQYYLNRIRRENFLKYLKLIGIRPRQGSPANADVTFMFNELAVEGVVVPKGARLAADEDIFETTESLTVVTTQLQKVISFSAAGMVDNTEANSRTDLYYFAFGQDAEKDSVLYLGFSEERPLPAQKLISLTFNTFEDYKDAKGMPIPLNSGAGKKTVPSAALTWEYFRNDRNGYGEWAPLTIARDETMMLSRSGRLCFFAPADMKLRTVNPFPDNCFWLRAVVKQAGYELPPRIDSVVFNTVTVVHTETLCELFAFSGTGRKQYTFDVSYLVLKGENYIQVLDENGCWQDSIDYKINKNEAGSRITVVFGTNGSEAPSRGRKNIRLISYRPELGEKGLIGKSTGLPYQKIFLSQRPVIERNFVLQAGEKKKQSGQTGFLWRDWIRVDDFDASGPSDLHYVLDAESGEITFGDGVNGAIPPSTDDGGDNIRLLSYRTGGGETGNVFSGAINYIDRPTFGSDKLMVENRRAARDGKDKETLEAAKIRARRSYRVNYRAVTSEDYERIACATPGIRVARAKAIPLFRKGTGGYPSQTIPALVTIVVVPFSQAAKPVPSKGFLQNVCRYLDTHRLVTTEISVQPPDYVEVCVNTKIGINTRFDAASVSQRISDELNRFLNPLTGGQEGLGWPFGRSVYKSEICHAIEKIDGVDYVEELALSVMGAGTAGDAEGNFSIPPHSLVCSGEHRIEIVRPDSACREKGGWPC